MFTKRTIRQQRTVEHVDTSVEALAVSIAEKAAVDLPFMAELTGKSEDEIASELTGVIFRLPAPVDENGSPRYITADEYLSGNVRQKLRDARAAAGISPIFEPNVSALEKAQPKDLDASEIDVRLGATWVDKKYIQQFMEELFEIPFYQRRAVQVQYSNFTSEWRIHSILFGLSFDPPSLMVPILYIKDQRKSIILKSIFFMFFSFSVHFT